MTYKKDDIPKSILKKKFNKERFYRYKYICEMYILADKIIKIYLETKTTLKKKSNQQVLIFLSKRFYIS